MPLDESAEQSRQYALVARAIAFIRGHATQQPSLEEIAAAVHVSPFHLQRIFAQWAGISPKRFLQYLTKEYAKQQLLASRDALSVTENAGLSSVSRLHDLMVSCEAMTPAEVKASGAGVEISFGFAASPFGEAMVGWTQRGVCHFAFCIADQHAMFEELATRWPRANLEQDDLSAQRLLQQIFPATPTKGSVHLVLRGTNFQIKVWEALIHTEFAQVVSYRQLAQHAGFAHAQRAVGHALAVNPIGFLIPCHRVIRESGAAGNYRWGADRKLAMLAWEAARRGERSTPATSPHGR
ncbi:methylated-DNA--[protein]-cysteine S-methyltransferase [Extensimonas vulgaris]|uniref:AraC family transcriptional regulator of adaptative response/methylated-DNA-[protein]-cysteine methyltransferase n=1 Tax=Extensimonas vulgaris TaxID=1031594 RepID=A0A369AL58_9BURK|nr:methylated-DNA--[protein]-cysteine S-methyltransferase [Extensimonas vulgaris]RCX10090.1 AraC family transcriptional regulator of adaptative response/methylated-DNA-[protein]-cysteine methyltransferase [Extensimonas vulgaris]TWI36513.1 DNA-O6-methylguanine--protein-cysteine S-methyltransferase /Transcriptional regulator Ada [Extensimonas vulgaris]TXD17242.1 methylated-DNA--[protein]-cysteine S-methyltransferase [Extensimonas vulgaris]